ncbi:MAG TPA: Mur ligase family protein, partial [Armatimonadota bacterium]|nr:Mur ligase family protein [Armatimonadota bacterium]
MDLSESLSYLSSLTRFGMVLGLERIQALCDRFDHPETKLRVLHVGGTKGKGSVSMMLSNMLHAAGQRVGTFVKPHLYDVRERVQVDLKPIDGDSFTSLMSEIKPAVAEVAAGKYGTPTEFEVKTLLMFLHFARVPVDTAVIEVGLGGTYDSTNVLQPLLSVITNISLDHVDRLGHTIPEIAAQKAGIIKAGKPVVTAARNPEAIAVIERAAADKDAPLWRIGRDFDYTRQGYAEGWQRFNVRTPLRE